MFSSMQIMCAQESLLQVFSHNLKKALFQD